MAYAHYSQSIAFTACLKIVNLRFYFFQNYTMKLPTTYFIAFVCLSITGASALDGWIYPWCSPISNERQPPQTRIVYGETALKGELPYQLQILWYWELVCGATLIQVGDTQAVLTTASCINGSDPFFYAVQASDWNLDVYETEQVREVDQVFIPDNYDRSRPYENDIALITLTRPFELNNLTAPIPLPPQGLDINPDGTLLASGWGTWYPLLTDYLTCKLQKVEMPHVDREMCQRIYSEYGVQLSESMFCVGQMVPGDPNDVGVGPCEVDFGGPLVDVEAGYLAGIMSHNPRCARVGYPVVSTRVSHYVDWIESKLNVSGKS